MIVYLVRAWNPWDCDLVDKKAFLDKNKLYKYLAEYDLNKEKEEELEVIEMEIE